jgi:hypothetical protein
MSDIIISLNNISQPLNIRYAKNYHGFSGSNFNSNKYLFELVIQGHDIGTKYFRNLEDTKYSHLIKLSDNIMMNSIESYVATVSIYPSNSQVNMEMEGKINKEESNSTQRNEHMYIEFTQNDMGKVMCCCFYTGEDINKIFASPPS